MSALAPIVIIAFNRPNYLRPVLESLVANGIQEREVHLFQDGGANPRWGTRFAEDDEIAASVATFRALVPHGMVHETHYNIGVGLNFRRAERHVFLDRGHELAYFFEDDMVLSPHYLTMLDSMAGWAMDNPKIAYFGAYGSQVATLKKQQSRQDELQRLTMHWGFASKRSAWLKINAFLDHYYYPFIEDIDYRLRKVRRDDIFAGMELLGVLPPVISQDAMKGMAMHVAGYTKANTFACFAGYIGAEGVHSNAERFSVRGYGKASLFPEPVQVTYPTAEQLDGWISTNQHRYEAVWRSVFSPGEGELGYKEQRRLANERLNPSAFQSRRQRRFWLF